MIKDESAIQSGPANTAHQTDSSNSSQTPSANPALTGRSELRSAKIQKERLAMNECPICSRPLVECPNCENVTYCPHDEECKVCGLKAKEVGGE